MKKCILSLFLVLMCCGAFADDWPMNPANPFSPVNPLNPMHDSPRMNRVEPSKSWNEMSNVERFLVGSFIAVGTALGGTLFVLMLSATISDAVRARNDERNKKSS